MQNLARGIASAEQQMHALKFIVERLAGTYEQAWFADNERESCHAAGRRFVGLELVKLCNMSRVAIAALVKLESGGRTVRPESNRDQKL